ncbi:phospholipase D-like domain-containing protein [Haloarcula sp. H-GB4]|uniref:phospholipase D-like domain-containing protein n=1 Tax=Haloarcula sp. H-GB4 TaxID=3069755 RepID=UPI0027B098FF|nr:phospholipase D-like domain-containing protein [Haloarcula sp. H-GB4]MDQ2074781.1 phospholipase D-like domain-containing protein [Haloarcula sp. H-GB4]
MSENTAGPDRALAIADIAEHDLSILDEVEGHLLVAAGRSESISPAAVGRETSLSRNAASDLFRQLNRTDAIHRDSHATPVVESDYTVNPTALRESLAAARTAIQVVASYRDRQPATDAKPLVTFPDDPSFTDITPAAFGMDGLMSTLASEVKQSEQRICLLSPFFERGGFDRLADVLLNALDRDVEVTIVTRYLQDTDSHNYAVISDFVQRARERGLASDLTTVDYTVWDDDVPAADRRQDGENPKFTLHAKVMSFDTRAVYVGSANMTDYGFGRYLELGVLLGRKETRQFVDLCDFLLESDAATAVRL